MKRICFVVAVPGTAWAFLRDHIKALQDTYEVHLAADFPDEESKKQFEGVICQDVAIHRKINLSADWKALWALRRLFKKEEFDAVHSVTPKAGLLAMTASWMAGIKHRIHIFTGQVWAMKTGAMRWLLKTMEKFTAHFATNILVDGEGQRQFIIKEGVIKESNSRVLADGSIAGVNTDRFIPSEEIRKEMRVEYGIADDKVVFVFMGRLNHDKGIGEIYEALNKLVPECPNAVALLFGNDEEGYDAKVEQYPNIKRGVNYLYPGHTSRPQDALQAGDVYILPTYREGFGLSVIEASCLGLPVICSDAYGVMDAMVEGVTGLRCKVGNPDSLYDCMKKLYSDADLRKKLGQQGRERVLSHFTTAVVTKAWVEYYGEILKA